MKFTCPLIRFSGIIYDRLNRHEKWIFLLFILVALFQVWHTKYVPSLDGPQHLYNANVLTELIRGNELFKTYFRVNDVIVGYWSGHFFLTLFKFFLPAWLAEKLFLTTYIIAFVLSFRYLVRSLNPAGGNFIAYLAFPFIFHFYLVMGYYSFSIAAIFFFLAFGYWIRHESAFHLKEIVIFGGLALGVFLSHALVFVLFGMAFLVYLAGSFIYDSRHSNDRSAFGRYILKALKAAAAVIPAVVLWLIYIRSVMEVNNAVSGSSFGTAELVKFLLRIRPLVGFHHKYESPANILLFVNLVLLTVFFLVQFLQDIRRDSSHWIGLLSRKNLWILVGLVFLGLYFFAPERISAGNLTHRFGLFFFLAAITWLSVQKFPKELHMITLAVVFVSFLYARGMHAHFFRGLNDDIAELRELSVHVEPNSVMHYQRASNNWIHKHFPLYVVVDEPVVHTVNPQCRGQFPVVWNLEELPQTLAGPREVVPAGARIIADRNTGKRQVDYVTIFMDNHYWKDSTNQAWIDILEAHYEAVAVSSGGKASLWKAK